MAQHPKLFPFLRYDDAPAAIEWLCAAFGFEKRFVAPGPQPGTIDHAQLGIGPEVIMIASARGAARGVRGSETEPRQGIYVYVPDVEAHLARAKSHGATVTQPLRHLDYGSHEYSALDCEGHAWSFGTYRGEHGAIDLPDFKQIDLVVRDMDATVAFYRALGVEIPESALWRTPSGVHHVDITLPGGLVVHFDSPALAAVYNRGWREPTGSGTRIVLTFSVRSRDEVDRLHGVLTGKGHPSSQPPFDAFWGARYAIVEDPDGTHVGIMSPSDPKRRSPPPNV